MKNALKLTAEAGKQDILVVREFDAAREVVFTAFTDPKYLIRWLGPNNMTMSIDYYDSRSGGSYRYVHTDPNGNAYGFHGVIHESTAPNRVIQTFEFEGLPESGHVALDIVIFEELPGKRTRVTIQSVFRSVADRDGMVTSGMERGLTEGFGRLDHILTESNL
jgi:uncharacterized protein YndB with AHSA1/START domain